MYMHPAKDHTIGVGYDASEHGDFALYQGIQISLFNIADPTDVVRVDNKIHGERGSSSEVTGNPHAFFYSEENNLFALPVIELGDHSGSRWDWNMTLKFSGAVVYEIEGDSLLERARLSHDEFIPESCWRELAQTQWWQNSSRSRDINRIYEVDGHLLTVSRYGLKQYSLDNLDNPVVSTEFPDAAQCVGGFSL